MDPISLTLIALTTGLTIFGKVKENQTLKKSGSQAIEELANTNLLAQYEAEADTIQKRTALAVEKARLAELARIRQKQYQQLTLAGLSAFCLLVIGLVIKNVRSK